MLRRLDARLQRLGRVTRLHRNFALRDDFPGVHARVDIVHGASGDFVSRGQGPRRGVGPAVLGEQRRMDVDDASRIGGEKNGSDNAHESGQHDEIDLLGAEDVDKFAFTFRVEFSARCARGNAFGPRPAAASQFENARAGLVGQNGDQLCGETSFPDGAADR